MKQSKLEKKRKMEINGINKNKNDIMLYFPLLFAYLFVAYIKYEAGTTNLLSWLNIKTGNRNS